MNHLEQNDLLSSSRIHEEDRNHFYNRLLFLPNMAGHQYNNPDCGCPLRVIGDFELIYFIGGKGYVQLEETLYECREGDVILIRPYEEHYIQSSRREPYDNYWVHFDIQPTLNQKEFINRLFPDHRRKVNIGVHQSLLEHYTSLLKEFTMRREGYINLANSYFTLIVLSIARLIHHLDTENPHAITRMKRNSDFRIIEKLESYVRYNYTKNISIQSLCRHLSISESYLFDLTKKYLNTTPGKYIAQVRMKRAETLIKNSACSIKEIAALVGFKDPLYFSKAFKKIYGKSPTEYAKSIHY